MNGVDVALRQTVDGGEITVINGIVELDGGLETSVYLSLFGGNVDDPGDRVSDKTWWGNYDETNPNRKYRSRLQYQLKNSNPNKGVAFHRGRV